jgi:hypothetical protein
MYENSYSLLVFFRRSSSQTESGRQTVGVSFYKWEGRDRGKGGGEGDLGYTAQLDPFTICIIQKSIISTREMIKKMY